MMGSETMVNICLPSESKTNNVDGIYIYPCVYHTVHILKVMELLHKDTHHIISNNNIFSKPVHESTRILVTKYVELMSNYCHVRCDTSCDDVK